MAQQKKVEKVEVAEAAPRLDAAMEQLTSLVEHFMSHRVDELCGCPECNRFHECVKVEKLMEVWE